MIDAKFMDSDIATEKVLAYATKQAQKVSQPGPHAFNGVGMHFSNTVAIIIACPFLLSVSNRRARALDGVVAVIFVRVNMRAFACKAFDMFAQRRLFGVRRDPQAHLSSFSPYCADHGWTIIGKRPASPSLVRPTARWISRVEVFNTFFPPRSGTFRRFRFPDRAVGYPVVRSEHWFAARVAVAAPSDSANPVRLPAHSTVRPSICPE